MIQTFEQLQKIITDVASEIGLEIQNANVMTSSDKDAKQLARFLTASCEELLTRYPWRAIIGNDPWVKTDTGLYKYTLDDDSDTPMMDARTLKLGTRWRYLQSKGLTYNEDFRSYELRIKSFSVEQNRDRTINLNDRVFF